MERRGQEGANPSPMSPFPIEPQTPIATAVHLAANWLVGVGFLRLHAALFAVAGAVLLLVDLILDPSDLWALDLLRIWLVVLGSHAAALAAGWSTWRAVRPDRLAASPLAWFLPDADESVDAAGTSSSSSPQPLPATGRFTPGWAPTADDDAARGVADIAADVFAAIGDALLDIADLARSGLERTRHGIARGIDWVRNEDDDDEEPPSIPRNRDQPDERDRQDTIHR